jgi:phospholipid N-methyltransferase
MQTKEEVLQNCTVEENIIKLPAAQLERKLYMEVAKSLELIGGKWKGGKVFGFVFPNDPTELLEQIANGEKRNLKKEFQFFATPEPLAKKLVSMAEIENHHSILEPSAGQGALVKAVNKLLPTKTVHCYELMPVNQTFLKKIETAELIGEDFLNPDNSNIDQQRVFDRIIANPPFSKNQDIDHIRKMYDRLKPGGRLVTISSKHWQYSSNKKETEFKQWLSEVDASIEEIEAGAFKESGTVVGGLIITINKN